MRDFNSDIHRELREEICSRFGLLVAPHEERNYLQAIEDVCQRFHLASPSELLEKMKASALGSRELEYLISEFTNGESYFFRDEKQFEIFKNKLLPELIAKKVSKNDHSLKIWSAGCSSGQELYSIAMIIDEYPFDFSGWNISLIGTDINVDFINLAIKGEYTEWSFRGETIKKYMNYFSMKDGFRVIDKKIRDRVTFGYGNLMDDNYPSISNNLNNIDIIFCRNVFIYFEPNTISHILNKFYNCLVDYGYLFVGPSDLINYNIDKKKFSYYRLNSSEDATNILTPQLIHKNFAPLPFSMPSDVSPVVHAIQREKVLDPLHVEAPTQDNKPQSFRQEAEALANLGHIKKAQEFCQKSLSLDPLDALSHLLMAQIYMEMRELPEAEKSLKKCLYLNPEMVEAHYAYALLSMRAGKIAQAIIHLKNALDLALRKNTNEVVSNMPGLNFGDLVRILERELEIYQQMLER